MFFKLWAGIYCRENRSHTNILKAEGFGCIALVILQSLFIVWIGRVFNFYSRWLEGIFPATQNCPSIPSSKFLFIQPVEETIRQRHCTWALFLINFKKTPWCPGLLQFMKMQAHTMAWVPLASYKIAHDCHPPIEKWEFCNGLIISVILM